MNDIDRTQNSDEITLYDLIEVLVRRKIVILGVFFSILGITIIYILTATPEYQMEATIVFGKVGSPRFSGKVFFVDDTINYAKSNNGKYGIKVSAVKNGTLILNKKVSGSKDIDAVIESIKKLSNEIFVIHNEYYNQLLKVASGYEEEINSQVRMIDKQLLQIAKIKNKITDKRMISLLSEERELKTRKVELHKELIKMAMFEKSGRKPYIAYPELPLTPISPKVKPIIVISLLLGLVLGIIAAYMLEFISNYRSRN